MISVFYMRETIAGIFQARMMILPSKMRYHTINILMRVPLKIRLRERLNFMVAPFGPSFKVLLRRLLCCANVSTTAEKHVIQRITEFSS